MAGIYYDPRVFAFGDALTEGVRSYETSRKMARDEDLEKSRSALLAEQITAAKRENARQTAFDNYMTDNASLYAPRTEEVPSADPMNPSEVNMTPVTLPPRKNMLEVAADAKLKSGDLAGYLDILKTSHSLQSKPHEIVNAFGTFLERVGKEGYLTPQIVKGAAKYMGVPSDIADNMHFDPQGNSLTMQERSFTRPELDALGFASFPEGKYNIKFAMKGGKLVPTEIKTIEDEITANINEDGFYLTKSGKPSTVKANESKIEADKDIRRFEKLYPDMAGKQGAPEYANAFKAWQRDQKQNLSVNVADPYDKILVTKTLTEIPKLKSDAINQGNNIGRINRALELVETGVTGKGGQVKAWMAPYAEMIGTPSKDMSDAQLFQMLTRVIVGPMRLDIIGPGPVSEWEQKLMQQISGGGGAAKDAARELLGYYKKNATAKVKNYNDTLSGLVAVYPKAGEVHRPIEIDAEAKSPAERQPSTAATIPKIGEVRKGYKFRGGNPADQKSWERVN